MTTGNLITGFLKGFGDTSLQQQELSREDEERKIRTKLFDFQLKEAQRKAREGARVAEARGEVSDFLAGPRDIAAPQPGGGPPDPSVTPGLTDLLASGGIQGSLLESGLAPQVAALVKAQQPTAAGNKRRELEILQEFLQRQGGSFPSGSGAAAPAGASSTPAASAAQGGASPVPQTSSAGVPGLGASSAGGFAPESFTIGGLTFKRQGDDPKSATGKLQKDIRDAERRGDEEAVADLNRRLALENKTLIPAQDFIASRDRLRKASSKFLVQRQAFNSGLENARSGTAFGDISLVFGLMKVLDPGSRVTSGEVASVENAGGIQEKIRNLYNRALKGESLLPEQRQDIINQMSNVFGAARDQQTRLIEDEIEFARRNNIDPRDLVPQEVRPIALPNTKLPPQDDPSAAIVEVVKGAVGDSALKSIVTAGGVPTVEQINQVTDVRDIFDLTREEIAQLPAEVQSALADRAEALQAAKRNGPQ